jgi:NitT/TauT family transport system ATP-binding protein
MEHRWARLNIVDVWKNFGNGPNSPFILKEINLTIERGTFYCLLGPSGCGKSTLLNIIASFEETTRGDVCYDDRPVTASGSDRVMIFQDISNALFPWLTAISNVEFGMKVAKIPRKERREKAERFLRLVGLIEHKNKFPRELSGGMKQRVQIARALVTDPEVLLMDEPFAALDAITKRHLQAEFRKIWKETKKTVVYVTHDIEEAILLGEIIAVMSAGPEACIRKEIEVKFKGDRSLSNPEFSDYYREIESLIEREVRPQ